MFSRLFGRDAKVSDAASLFGRLFQENTVEGEFYDSLVTHFLNFDEFNQDNQNKLFSNDVEYIAQCTINDLTSTKNLKKSSQRIDSYFYIYRRIEQYIKISKQDYILLHQFRQKIFEILRTIFTTTNGKQPNIYIKDKSLLKEINIFQHLSSIVTIKDQQMLHIFFVLFKLSIQSSIIIDGNQNHFKWKDILLKVQEINLSLEDFIGQYIIYKDAFQQCPLDMSEFIYLIQKMHPSKQSKISPFITFFRLSKELQLDDVTFFKNFQPIFDHGLKIQRYEMRHISELLVLLSSHDQLFYEYLSIYSLSAGNDGLWQMYLNLSRISDLNVVMRKHLSTILSKRISTVSFGIFQLHIKSAKECLKQINVKNRPYFIEIFEQIYNAFVLKEIPDKGYLTPLGEMNLKELLNIDSSLIPIDRIDIPSKSLIIQQLLFKIDPSILNTAEKIKRLFHKIKNFDENICKNNHPVGIIKDDWLEDFIIIIPQVWIKLDQDVYKYLCNNHQNNPWTIYVWSRIVHLSLLKTVKDNPNMTVLKLNEWMKNVKHDVYNSNDILTIIFVKNLFELIIVKHMKSMLLLPNIETIIKFIISIKERQPDVINVKQVDDFIRNGCQELEYILQLKGTRSMYRELLNGSVIRCFLPDIDLRRILTATNPQQYKFPLTTPKIDAIISLRKPKDIDITNTNSKELFFDRFIQDINEWFPWLDKFIDIFQHIIEWLKTYNINRTIQLSLDLSKIKDDPKLTVIQLKTTVETMSKVLLPFNDLQRLCHLFNCLTSFRIIDQGALNNQDNVTNYIKELKRFQPNNTFTVENGTVYEHKIPITDRQNVRWSFVNETHPCNIKIQYRTNELNDPYKLLYEQNNAPINRNVLCGQFETKRSGQLLITIDNRQKYLSHILWYRIRSVNLSTCHLFHGILNMFKKKIFDQPNQIIPEKEFSKLIDLVFVFIDNLLNGSLTLKEMADLRTIFFDKNIHIKEEVEKLFTSRSIEQIKNEDIEQVCEWLQIYQYYSHISVIMDCIAKFGILSSDSDDESIGHLQRLGTNENCTLREITQAYRILQQRFQNLTHQHLQLIKTAVECPNVIHMMKKADLYSNHGRRRFQELRDNLTTQFQLQEKNNMILNSWIITYALIEPFMYKVKKFDDFLALIARLSNLEESSLNHIKIINDNVQIVNMWLSAEDTTVLDNALITMEHLYKSGAVDIRLCHLMNEQSYFEIGYSIDRIQGQTQETNENTENDKREPERIKFNLSMADIDDHKRQLTFCKVDVQQNIFYNKALINGQLKLLETIEKIYSALKKLEMAGHPDYQLREEHYEIHAQYGAVLGEFRNNQNARLEQAVKTRIDNLEFVYKQFNDTYNNWIKNLEKYRQECCLLKLFSNRQIMILIILLRTSVILNSVRNRFLKKLFSFKNSTNQNNEEHQLTIQCLKHYLSSLRIKQCDLLYDNISHAYETHQIEPGSNTELCLKKLCQFLQDLLNNGNELMEKRKIIDENQQYLVTLETKQRSLDENISFEHDLDMNTLCILLNIFHDRLPSSYQILWCSIATAEDIQLFFSRIRTFPYLIFVIMNIDKMNHRLRELLLNEQDLLRREQVTHGTVYYFSRELTTSRNGLIEFHIPPQYRNPNQTYKQLITLFQRDRLLQPEIQIICGTAGIGKTHRINTQYKDDNTSCFSINDNLNVSSLISSFLVFDSKMINDNPAIYFNISIHAPFEQLNRTLFSLFICGSLMDAYNGLVFSLPIEKPWKFIVEIPYSKISGLSIKENFNKILPLLSIISPSNLEEVTSDNYQLYIGEEEELVARFLKAYENRTIDRLAVRNKDGTEPPLTFDRITDPDECRRYIYNCMINYAPELPRNKIYELSFTKFLYRRVCFFVGSFYCWNEIINQLGSTAMKQMIDEAKSLAKINFRDNDDPYRVFLVYDPGFSLHLLHNDWNRVSYDLKQIFNNLDPLTSIEYRNKDYFVECLAWLIDIPYDRFIEIMNEKKFILTENFAYKLFHVHERKLTKLALIIEGDTGVGKTFLLKFYSALLNAKNTKDQSGKSIIPRIVESANSWLRKILITMVENQPILLNTFVQQIKRKLLGLDNNDEDEDQPLIQPPNEQHDVEFLNEIKLSLENFKYNEDILYYMWKTILTISSENNMENTSKLIQELHDYVTLQLSAFPLIEPSIQLTDLLQTTFSPSAQLSIGIFKEYLNRCQIKPLFYRLLLHPGITEEQVKDFMIPIIQLARQLSNIELVVFFDEVNTSSCLGLFKEMFMDGTLHGISIPKNIFFTAAINPFLTTNDTSKVHRNDYIVHQLPQSLENLMVFYGALESRTLADYIFRKIAMFQVSSSASGGKPMPLDTYVQQTLAECILGAQEFCEKRLARNSVSQREIQRCFNLIEFFWKLRYDNEITNGQNSYDPNPIRCIALSLALIYYFRLPTKEDNSQRKDDKTPSREELTEILSRSIPDFDELIQTELETFVNTNNFAIPHGVAINQAVREHIFSIVVSIVSRTPLCIIGEPGQSKTLSFQIVLQNLQGSQLSPKPFCKRLPAVDPFFCLGSKYSRSEDIAYIFERAIKREQQYEQNRMDIRCVVFLDEASLPDEKKMVLKVLHHYLDECKVAFVAIANKSFDAANANRMLCVYRSLPSKDDQKILAYGCLGLQLDYNQRNINNHLENIIYGLCQGYRRILSTPNVPRIFHDRDFIYTLRELRFELSNINEDQELSIGEITPRSLLRALEDNFNGIKQNEFEELVKIFFKSVEEKSPQFCSTNERQLEKLYRDVPTILRESMKLDSKRRRLYGRYKLIIDESEDESAVHLLFQSGVLDPDPNRTTVFRMPDFPDDVDNELRNVEILSTIKLCMETGKTILMVNTGRIHGSLYDVFNQNFSIMATDETRKIFSKVAIGPKTMDVVVHEDFQCIVHIKRSEFDDIPPPFLSRFQKYSLSVTDFYSIYLKQLPINEQELLKSVEEKILSFIQHFGQQYFYGLNDSTLYSCLLTLIKKDENGQYFLSNIHHNYSQLTIKSKLFIEQNSIDIRQCLLLSLITKLIQLVSPESIIYRLPTLDDEISSSLCNNYFYQQEHFNIDNFIHRMLSSSSIEIDSSSTEDISEQKRNDIIITTKVMIFTRTSTFVTGLNKQSKNDLLKDHEKIDVLNLAVIENSVVLQEQFHNYEQDNDKQVLIIVIDGRISQQRLHIPFIRQLIDNTENSCNIPNQIPQKFFIILVHSTRQELDHQLLFPSIFLHDWDYHFIDTGTSGGAFHLQSMLQIFTSSFNTHEQEKEELFDNNLYDLNMLFNDCLLDFCSRIQIILQDLPSNMFKNNLVYEFYQRETSTRRRFQCLKEILQQSTQLQKRIINSYYENVTMNKKSIQKTCNSIYQISKDILCGKRSNSLVDSLQSQIRVSFTNFVSNILKFIVNDYGLETLFKLSTGQNGYESLLNLIDYSAFPVNDDIENDTPSFSKTQGIFQLTNHYSCIPQTPLYHLFHQRIKTLADAIKLTLHINQSEYQEEDDDEFRQDYNAAPTTTMAFNNSYQDNEETEYTSRQYRNKLIESMMNDKILTEIISQPILESYTNDTVRTLCTIVEKSFNNNLDQCQKTIEFVSNWLLLIDENDNDSLNISSNKDIWLLAHVYTFFEHDQNDLFSLYSACRITDQLDPTQSFYNDLFNHNQRTRSIVREDLFRLMFDYLWKNLCHLCSTNESTEQWIHSYTFISKYYPSDKVLQHMQLARVKGQIEFMNLAYLIFLNESTPGSKELVLQLLKDTSFIHDDIDGRTINYETSICLKLLPIIINTIHKYLENKNINNSTLMIDIQQWILLTLKSSNQSCEEEIKYLFKFLNQSTCQLSLSMKQFLFDELTNILFKLRRQNRPNVNRQNIDFWDRIFLLPIISDCITDVNLQNYQIPYHPSIITDNNQKQTLFDLFFFHLKRCANDETVNCQLINKILMSGSPQTNDRRLIPMMEIIFKQLKDYFSIQMTALLFCEKDLNNHEQLKINQILSTIIDRYLLIDPQLVQLNKYLELFLSIIITKRSWNFLLNLLKSERFQRLNAQWSNTLFSLLEIKHNSQRNKYLQLCHQLQFTLTTNITLSIFPKLHQPYEELSKLIDQCIKNNDQEPRWKPLSDWTQLKLTSNPPVLNSTEIKVMLLLNIYYDYYCNNQLESLDNLLVFIENNLQPSPEELRVFHAFLQPEENLIGYPRINNNIDRNYLNNLFKLDCKDDDELSIRHSLVNLLAMILLSGKQNFLWTFTFEPLKLQNTLGFGSTRHEIIQTVGVHYDCGCLFSENGDLIQFLSNKGNGSALNVPVVYVAYFSTFGALAWHLLLFDTSVQNLYGPILAKHAVDDTSVTGRITGDSVRAKLCHFVRARLLATYHFLSIRSNQDDACILLNRCFEQMAQLTNEENLWIKPIYPTFEEKFQAEQEYQNKIFYPIHQQLAEYKQFINSLHLQSQIQKILQDYVSQMPILIQFIDFKTELCNPKNSQLSLNILRNILDSFDFLKITHFIYDLSQFYLLLHQTYTQLIERDEFSIVTLKELYERGQKYHKNSNRLNYSNQNNQHLSIIENGIKAVNAYHKFADGLIRPGACDETQRFTTISIETPIHYLVTTENHDEGDIIMRILSVLVDYHNSLLDLMEKEMNTNDDNNGINLLKDLINNLSSKELSILQIVQENTGVITLNDNDCLWIERLSRSSLQNEEEYFPKFDTQFNFNFLYIQFYIIRSYLLFCHINYHHIHGKYQCYTQRQMILPIDKLTSNESLYLLNDPQFNYLQEMTLSKLYKGYNLLRQILDLSKHYQADLLNGNLYEFVQIIDNNNNKIYQELLKKYEIKDFQLCYIDDVCQLYEQLINQFHYSIINTSHLLHVPIDDEQNEELDQLLNTTLIQFDHDEKAKELQSKIRTITEFLNELEEIEDRLLQESSQSLTQICEWVAIENPIVSLIPQEIKCENYVLLVIKLIEIRSKLQEETINIEEKNETKWSPSFYHQTEEQKKLTSIFDQFRWNDTAGIVDPGNVGTFRSTPILDPSYTILFELNIKSVPLTSSMLFDQILKQTEIPFIPMEELHFTIIYTDGTTEEYSCQNEKLIEQLNKIFKEKNYDFNQFIITDRNHLFLDLTNENVNSLPSYISEEYYVIEKSLLISIIVEFEERQMEYFATRESQISSIINRFLIDQEIRLPSDELFLGFFDELGMYIEEDSSINNIYRPNNTNTIRIKVIQCENNINNLCEVILRSKEDKEEMKLFDPITEWKQIATWLKTQKILQDMSVDTYEFWDREHGNIIDEHQSIFSTLDNFDSIIIDGFTKEPEIEIILSYDNHQQNIRILRSDPIFYLLNKQKYSQEFNFEISPTNSILVLSNENDKKFLSNDDMQQPIKNYLINDQSILHFEIWILIQLIQYDNREEIEIPISTTNLTIKDLLIINTNTNYQYLALMDTHRILLDSEILSNINQTKFFFMKENQTCLISIKNTRNQFEEIDDNNTINQRYRIDSTIANIYKQNEDIIQDGYLVYENDFILSQDTTLTSLQQGTSSIEFILIDRIFPANITVINEEQNTSIQFYCLSSISIRRIRQIACQLFNLNEEDYHLISSYHSVLNDDQSLDSTDEPFDNIQLKLIPTTHFEDSNYISLFELNIESVPLTASVLFEQIRNQQKANSSSVPNTSRFEIIHSDSTRQRVVCKTENIYPRFKTLFQEKKYDFDRFIIVNQNQIFVDFLNENNEKLSPRISLEYHIIEKTLLTPILLKFESKEIEYLVTLTCQISSIINRFIVDHQLTFTSSNIYLGFFDELGSYIDEDKTILDIYRSNNTNPIQIRVLQYEDDTNYLYEVTLKSQEDIQQRKLFHPMTKWYQIDLWLKTLENMTDTFTQTYNFCDREQKVIINEDESLFSTINPSTSIIIDGINNEEIMEVTLSYETNKQNIRILKSCPVSDLLSKQHYLQQLNIIMPPNDCILVRIKETDNEILTEKDLQQPMKNYLSIDNQKIDFRIAILIQIIQYDNNQVFSLPISNRNITIEQLIKMIPKRDRIYEYLSSYDTHMVLSNNEQLSNLMETKFHLVKDTETFSIIIDLSENSHVAINEENIEYQRYTSFATIADLYKQNNEIIKDQYLLFDNIIVLSPSTPLTCFLQIKSPIRFTLISKALQANITITNDEQQDFLMKFQCLSSIELERLSQIACQLFNVNKRFYRLIDFDDAEVDESMLLYELTDSVNDIQFKLKSIADVKCLIIYEERKTIISAYTTTLISTILEEALEKLFIPREHINMYVLKILDDPENPTDTDLSMSMGDILEIFSMQSTLISFQLTKN